MVISGPNCPGPNCPSTELSWYRIVRVQIVLVPNCPGPNCPGPNCPGPNCPSTTSDICTAVTLLFMKGKCEGILTSKTSYPRQNTIGDFNLTA